MDLELPAPDVHVHGLPWFSGNYPDLYRFPKDRLTQLPERVSVQARFPAGARVRFSSDSVSVSFEITGVNEAPRHGIDVYLDGGYLRTVVVAPGTSTYEVFDGFPRRPRLIELYLPYRQEIRIDRIVMDQDASVSTPPAYRGSLPLVFYGSSVAQGVGSGRSSVSYEAALSRMLGLDYVNLGFGGAGKAEPEVVELVASIDACCYLFDLGKSYGAQSHHAYSQMLRTVRDAHPDVPIICITPIYSTRERYSPEYSELSNHTRSVVVTAAEEVKSVRVMDGLTLLGEGDADGLSNDGVHPSELGFQRIAERLEPEISRLVKA